MYVLIGNLDLIINNRFFLFSARYSIVQSNFAFTEPIIYGNHCAGTSTYTKWITYSIDGISMDIDTRNCSFNKVPFYYTSISGINLQDNLMGHNSIYLPTLNGFRIYCRSYSGLTSAQLLNASTYKQWDVNWVGVLY